MKRFFIILGLIFFAGCSVQKPDYRIFRQNLPKSILVMPPMNSTNSVKAPELFLAAVTQPLGEAGYYVYPPLTVLKYFQAQGIPFGTENIDYKKLREVFGADAVLYSTIEDWGEVYQIISAQNTVKVQLSLIDLKSEQTIWAGEARAINQSGGSSWSDRLIGSVIHGIIHSSESEELALASKAALLALHDPNTGIIYGSRRPNFSEDTRGLNP